MNNTQGWLNVYKPISITSFGVLKKIKQKFNINKIGHAGTLDPLAEGILPIAIGKATKLIQFISSQIKEYASTGIDIISSSAPITKSKWIDFSMRFNDQKES